MNKRGKNMDIKKCTAYELIEKQELAELDSTAYLIRHKKTKAKIALLENEDNNKVFSIGFRTPPKDSTGVAHIVEHTVLCGSKEFPVKDPFIELAKGSLNTFLNAMTYPDKTVYPVASCNDKDFKNLMHVYLDAVFYPNIYKEEKIFRQEGWHYELESVDAPLKYNGVVFNEMKGVFSSPDQLLCRNIQHSLFPDTAYGVESGGDPAEIPNLTYEDYLDFHSRYYHPSNSYIYLYGDMDMEERLNWLDEHYLKDFDYLQVDSEIALQPSFDEPKEEYGFYSATEGEDTEGKAYFSYNVVCGDSLDRHLYRSLRVLDHVLVDSVGAPVKQALLDAGIGSEISSSYDSGVRQPWFSIVAKNVKMEQKSEFLKIIRDTLEDLVKNGLNKKSLLAAINAMEFQYREADFGSYPKGLMYGLQMFDSWLYDEEKPFVHLKANDIFEDLKKQIDEEYYEQLIQKYFLDNPHASFVSIQPKVGLTALMDKEENEKLAAYKQSLTQEELERLVRETKELLAYQEEPTPPEALACIPLLTREDIGKKARPFQNEERELAGCNALFHNVFTNDISYIRFGFDIMDLKEYAPYIGLLTELIGFVDTDVHDKLELSNEILLHAGSFGLSVSTYEKKKSGGYSMRLEVTTKVLYPETEYVIGLIKEMLTSSHVWDEKRLREVIGEARAGKQMSLQASGHTTAAWRAMSYVKERMYYVDQLKGVAYYDFLCDMDDHFDERKENLTAVLKSLVGAIFVKERMSVGITADKEGFDRLAETVQVLADSLPDKPESVITPEWKLRKIQKNEGFKTAGKVQYVARAGDFKKKNIPYDGSYRVVKTILSYDYLWNEVRVKGGAYGVMCAFAEDGMGYLMSYRDPNLSETNDVYMGIPEYLESFEADERDMMKYIIGTISDMDTPLTPRAKGERSYLAYMTEITWEDKQREREEVLATDTEKVQKAAAMVRAILSDNFICALGGEEKVEKEKDLFESVRTLK
jgi:hypothetical protein